MEQAPKKVKRRVYTYDFKYTPKHIISLVLVCIGSNRYFPTIVKKYFKNLFSSKLYS